VTLAVLAFLPSLAEAQEMTPPRVLSSPAPIWPEGEPPREAEVVVTVDVGPDGRVTGALVERGVTPGLDAAALEAARALVFSPARSGGVAVASRVRLAIRLDPAAPPPPRVEPVPPSPPPPDQPTTSGPSLPEGEADPESGYETVVVGERVDVSRRTLQREEVRQTPGTMGDPFRVIETLPGVVPIFTGLPYYFVRGAPPADTGYFFDGVRVPALFHLALGPSVIHPYLVDRVDFWAGGAPARFPGYVGGIVSAESAPLPRDRPHLDVDVRLVDAGAIAIVPFGDGDTRASVSGRYSYTAALLSAVAPGVVLEYWDYQAKVEHDLGPGRTASLFVFGSYDLVGEEEGDTVRTNFAQEFHRVVATHRWTLPGGRSLDLGLAGGYERIFLGEAFHIDEYTLGPRARYGTPLGRSATLHVGADGTWAHSDLGLSPSVNTGDPDDAQNEEALEDALGDPDIVDAGAYAELDLRPQPKLTLLPGLRLSAIFAGDVLPAADPRFAFRYELAPQTFLKGSVGRYHQRPNFFIPLPGLDAADLDRGLQRSTQASQGVEWGIPEVVGVDAQIFFHRYENLSDIDFLSDEDPPPRMKGNAYGLEVILRRPMGRRFFGWIAYTLSRNERSFESREAVDQCPTDVRHRDDDESPILPGTTTASEFDRTHIVNVVASYLFPWDIRGGGRLQYRSGHPYTSARCETPDGHLVYGRRNGERTVGYLQLDLRIDKRWRYAAWDLELYFEFINATFAADELAQLQYDLRDGNKSDPTLDFAIPIVIPTLGVRGVF